MIPRLPRSILLSCLSLVVATQAFGGSPSAIVVSVPDQRLALVENGVRVAQFPISTSKFGIGDRPRSFATPLGMLRVASKVGFNAPKGTVFKNRRATGEIIRPNAPGRDPIVTRILRLRGTEAQNSRAYARGIYIHGTPEERRIGRPASFGCIRMRSGDMVRLFDAVAIGAVVDIVNAPLNRALPGIIASL